MVLVEPLVQVVLQVQVLQEHLVQAQVGHQVHQEVQVQEELVVHRVHQVVKVIKVVFNTNTVVGQEVHLLQVNLLIKERVLRCMI
jgi:hypothetical protein